MSSDTGSSTVLISSVVGLIAAVSIATAGLGLAYSAKTRAQTGADAAALAAAVGTYPPAATGLPSTTARVAAGANGATLVSCSCPIDRSDEPRVVRVTVKVDVDLPVFGRIEVRATSRAEFDPGLWRGR